MAADQAHPIAAGPTEAGMRGRIPPAVEYELAVLTLDDGGLVCDCNGEGEALFRYHRDELVGRHVSLLVPQLKKVALMQDGRPNPHLQVRCRFGCHFRAVTRDGEYFIIDLFLNLLGSSGHERLSVIVRRTEEAGVDNGLDPIYD